MSQEPQEPGRPGRRRAGNRGLRGACLPAIENALLLRGSSLSFTANRSSHTADIPASGSSAASPRGRRKQPRGQAESHHLPGQPWPRPPPGSPSGARTPSPLPSGMQGQAACLRAPGSPLSFVTLDRQQLPGAEHGTSPACAEELFSPGVIKTACIGSGGGSVVVCKGAFSLFVFK